ncbi:unnamed protein product [Tetraodon nigroviridis]|uniref:(spotted green pufferfish) hypothetical protein n=1 Tax=Tetraodon nigroviridis TaxID=99883 RepID=Q4RJW2_TETNG|nr:unnamed protein product [Tetraodon nigroviridis]
MADCLTLFVSIGLSHQKAKETLKNEALSASLKEAIVQAERVSGASELPKATGTLLYTMASRLKDSRRLAFLTDSIALGKLCTEQQLTGKLTCHNLSGPSNEGTGAESFWIWGCRTPKRLKCCGDSYPKAQGAAFKGAISL